MRTKRRPQATLAGAVFLLAALPPAAAAASDAQEYANVHTIAIVPMLKNDLALQTMGMTILDNSSHVLTTDWDFNRSFAERATAALGPRFQIGSATLPPGLFDNINPGLFGNYWELVAERIRALPKPAGVDAYLIAVPVWGVLRDDPARGMFVYHDAGLLTGKGTVMALPYYVHVLDATTGKRIDYGEGEIPMPNTFSGYGSPTEHCADDVWPPSPAELTSTQRDRIRQEAISLLMRSVPFALFDAKLISEDSAKAMLASAPPAEPSCHGI